jgi:hypothetical protein
MIEMIIVGTIGVTQEELKESFYYVDGDLFFKPFTGSRNRVSRLSNRRLGYRNKDGYFIAQWRHHKMYLHRMIFLYHHGYLPEQVDHIDGNKGNNKIENLRAANNALNMHNTVKRKDNTSGIKGVWYCKRSQRWIAEFVFNKKKTHVGSFLSKEEAAQAIKITREQIVKEFANHG